MKRFPMLFGLWVIMSITLTSIAQTECPAIIEFALNSTNEFCQATDRNQACFGHVNLTAEAQPDAGSFEFVEVGDIVDVATIRTLRLSTLDTSAGAWGVVLMRLQANLPDATPGQNVTFMLFGDTEIRNAATSVAEQDVPTVVAQIASSLNANVRVGPDSAMAVLASVPSGTDVVANGQSPDGEWIRINVPDSENDSLGWISSQLITTTGDFGTLNVVQPGQPQFGPMQAFYLSTGIGAPVCNEMPDNGMLVQTPKGVGEINLLVNEVEISMGSTVFLSAPRADDSDNDERINVSSMKVKTIEGAAVVRRDGDTTAALGGSQFEIVYDDEGFIERISESTSLEFEEIDDLPYELLEREFEFDEPLTDEELEILENYDELFGLVDIDETDELLDYIDEFGDDDLVGFLQNELGMEYFDGETAEYFEDELGFELEGFDDYYDDDYGDDGIYDEYGDEYDDYGDDGYSDYEGDDYYDDIDFDDYDDDEDYDDDYEDYDDGGDYDYGD